ncbi:MAG: efflux RND transporter periplasmic adaptor subunit [Acidobacteria bacterium]|nr:efflux RND transporter periplasmic adaptor subunit [Acidobacteriota bacterium]
MDREIDVAFRRKLILRRSVISLLLIAAFACLLIFGPAWIKPSLNRSRIRTAKVETGALEATITASGTVVPEFEQVISSPVDARVLKILKRPGDLLVKGEAMLQLDVSASVLAVEKANQQIDLKQNAQAKAKIDLESTLNGLQSQIETKTLDHKSLSANSTRNRELYKSGLLAEDKLREVELLEEKAALELRQLEVAKRTAQQSTKTQLEGLALELSQLEKERDEAKRQLDLATTKSDRNGVLTWVVLEEGATISKGSVIARIADLNSFRVDATISDVHANRLSPGMPVSIKINDDYLKGTIRSIDPTIKNGVITLQVSLVDKSSALLKSNLRCDVLVVTDHKEKTLRIKKGPFANAEGSRDVFVIRGDTAIKTPVKFGIASFDFYEVLEGLLEGDEVIISDMTDYQHLKEVKMK